jgi:hypothetical protein
VPSIQWTPGTLSLGIKWPGCEADHSSPAHVKNDTAIPVLPQTSSWHNAQLIKHRVKFSFIGLEYERHILSNK